MTIIWQDNIDTLTWDQLLTQYHGHPLQSAKWGDARKQENIRDHRWCAYQHGQPVYLVRFEERYFLHWIEIAWVPKGPVYASSSGDALLYQAFLKRLKTCGYRVCIDNGWRKIVSNKKNIFSLHTI